MAVFEGYGSTAGGDDFDVSILADSLFLLVTCTKPALIGAYQEVLSETLVLLGI